MPNIKTNRVGQKYGKLIVVSIVETNNGSINYGGIYFCQCDCGKTINVRGYNLRGNKYGTRSCGCLISEAKVNEHKKKRNPERSTKKEAYRNYKRHAIGRNIKPLNYETWNNISSQKCYYCSNIDVRGNWERSIKRKDLMEDETKQKFRIKLNGIDRVDRNIKTYENNAVSSCEHCNKMKFDYTKEEFFSQVKRIYEHHNLSCATNKEIQPINSNVIDYDYQYASS